MAYSKLGHDTGTESWLRQVVSLQLWCFWLRATFFLPAPPVASANSSAMVAPIWQLTRWAVVGLPCCHCIWLWVSSLWSTFEYPWISHKNRKHDAGMKETSKKSASYISQWNPDYQTWVWSGMVWQKHHVFRQNTQVPWCHLLEDREAGGLQQVCGLKDVHKITATKKLL